MEHVDRVGHILRRAEKTHGHSDLTFLQVLEAAEHPLHPPASGRVQQLLLTLSMDPEPNWWKKLARHVSRLQSVPETKHPSLSTTSSVTDRFQNMMAHHDRRVVEEKQSATQRAVPVDPSSHDVLVFRVMANAFQRWARITKHLRNSRRQQLHASHVPQNHQHQRGQRGLAPMQFKALVRWLQFSWPASTTSLSGQCLSQSFHARNRAVQLASDRLLRLWTVTRVWRGWMHHVARCTQRNVDVQRKRLQAMLRRRHRCFLAWHMWAAHYGPKLRQIQARQVHSVTRQGWRRWLLAMELTHHRRRHQQASLRRLWRRWIQFVHRRQNQYARLERTVALHDRQVALAAWRQWRLVCRIQRQGRALAARCDAVAVRHCMARGLVQWHSWYTLRRDQNLVTTTAVQHADRSRVCWIWRHWAAYVIQRRRLHALQSTLPQLFDAALHVHYLSTWRLCTHLSIEEAKAATAMVHFHRRARFWREWKQRKLVAVVVRLLCTQEQRRTRTVAFQVWLDLLARQHHRREVLEAHWARWRSLHVAQVFTVWHQYHCRQDLIRLRFGAFTNRRLEAMWSAWRTLTQHRRHVRQSRFAQGLALHTHKTMRTWWVVWASQHRAHKIVELHRVKRRHRCLNVVFVKWGRAARKRQMLRTAVSIGRQASAQATMRRVFGRWSSVTKVRRTMKRVLNQRTVCRDGRLVHLIWQCWRTHVDARKTLLTKLQLALAWSHHHCLSARFTGWRRVVHAQQLFRAKSRLVLQTLGQQHVGRTFQRWRAWLHHEHGKKDIDALFWHRRLRSAVRSWRLSTSMLRWVRHTLPQALGCSKRHTYERIWRRWCKYTQMSCHGRQQLDIAEVAWSRRTLCLVWKIWVHRSRTTSALRSKVERCVAVLARRQMRMAVTTLHTTAVFRRKLHQWTSVRGCQFFSTLTTRVFQQWQEHTRTQSSSRRVHAAHAAHMQRRRQRAALHHWIECARSNRFWTDKLRQAKRWFQTTAVHFVFTTWKTQVARVRRQKHSMRSIVQRWHQLELAGFMTRWRMYTSHRLRRADQTAVAATVFRTSLYRRAIQSWKELRRAQLALKRNLQDLLGTRRLTQLQHCTTTWRHFVRSKKALVAKLHEFMATSSATLLSTRFNRWHRHAKLAPQLRWFRQHRHNQTRERVLHEWRQLVFLRHRFHAAVALLEGRSMSSVFAHWRRYVKSTSERRLHALEHMHWVQSKRHVALFWHRWREWQSTRPLLRHVAVLWGRTQRCQALCKWKQVMEPLRALAWELHRKTAHHTTWGMWKLWRALFIRQCHRARSQAAVNAMIELLAQAGEAPRLVCMAVINRWKCVVALRGFERWRYMAVVRRTDRSNSIQALHHWLARQMSLRFAKWREVVRQQQQRRAAIHHFERSQRAHALRQWMQFIQRRIVQVERKQIATQHWVQSTRQRALTTWVHRKRTWEHYRQSEQTIHASVVRRVRANGWAAWMAHVTGRQVRRHLLDLVRAFRCQVVLKRAMQSWHLVTRTLADARSALQATVLRLEVLIQLPCLRAWRNWTCERQRRRHAIQALERRRRWSVLHVQFHWWRTTARSQQIIRHRWQSSRRRYQLERGVHALVQHREVRVAHRVARDIARSHAQVKQDRWLWKLVCFWYLWARRQSEMRVADAFATHCHIQRWRRWTVATQTIHTKTHHIINRWTTGTIRRVFRTWNGYLKRRRLVLTALQQVRQSTVKVAFAAWVGYHHGRQKRLTKSMALLRAFWANVEASTFRQWQAFARRRTRVRAIRLPQEGPWVVMKAWREWRAIFRAHVAGRKAQYRRVWRDWQHVVAMQKRKVQMTEFAEQMAQRRAIHRWRCFHCEQTALAAHQSRALLFLTGRTEAKLFLRWKDFTTRQHRCREHVAILSGRISAREFEEVASAWVAHFRMGQRRKQRVAAGIVRTQQRWQKRAIADWIAFVSNQTHHSLQHDLAWQFRAQAVVLRCFQRWIRHVLEQKVLRAKCTRVGHLIMGHVVQRLFMTWQSHSQAKSMARKRCKLAASLFQTNSCRYVWAVWTKRLARARWRKCAHAMAARHLLLAHWRQWMHHHVAVKVIHFMGAALRHQSAQCFKRWFLYTRQVKKQRVIVDTALSRMGMLSRSRVFQAWKRQAWLMATNAHLISRWYTKLAIHVWAAWRRYTQRGIAAAVWMERRMHVHQTVRRQHWAWWRQVFVASHHHRLRTTHVILAQWRAVLAARHRATLIVFRTRAATMKRHMRVVLLTWHSHVALVKAAQRQLLQAHRRDQWIARMDRVRTKRMAHTHWHEWVRYVAVRSIHKAQWRSAWATRMCRRVFNGWLARKVAQKRFHHAYQRRCARLLADAVGVWTHWVRDHGFYRAMAVQATALNRHHVLKRRWQLWHSKALQATRLYAVARARQLRTCHAVWHGWLVFVQMVRQTRHAFEYARLRLLGQRMYQWLAFLRFGRRLCALQNRVWSHRLCRIVRLWARHRDTRITRRQHLVVAKKHMARWNKRVAVVHWTSLRRQNVHRRAARAYRLRQIWRRWRSVVMLNFADRFFAKTTTQRCWTSWQHLAKAAGCLRSIDRLRRRRHMDQVFRTWHAKAKARQIGAQATVYGTLKAQQRVLLTWRAATEAQKRYAEAMAETATRRGYEWHLRTRWRQWRVYCAHAKRRRARLSNHLSRWCVKKQANALRTVWRAWSDVARRRATLRMFLKRHHRADLSVAWTAWGEWRRRKRAQVVDKKLSDTHFGECIQRKVFYQWHAYAAACNHRLPA
ncbi:hypothetical protein H310_01668 [Aphanomyces invadans]|uniref:Uncharacterized protein n=1 Tax=Aphanomyces invadans TaxID=157072 RepID=A0A024USD7_9STRA|nr:hypothetical protein H310_01668 [Aphanomyces invadans]ETW09269.1 hypothetical protein H310_01668 [Aphanomyces invadans]|eukprot:XP_008863074.1 hypothetical protein H310_01668 [Aphanomyces invadans]